MHLLKRFLGTDKSENWTVAEFKEFSRPHFVLGKSAWTYIPLPGIYYNNKNDNVLIHIIAPHLTNRQTHL